MQLARHKVARQYFIQRLIRSLTLRLGIFTAFAESTSGLDVDGTADLSLDRLEGDISFREIRLRNRGLYGAIIGKAYYAGAVDLAEAVREGGPQ